MNTFVKYALIVLAFSVSVALTTLVTLAIMLLPLFEDMRNCERQHGVECVIVWETVPNTTSPIIEEERF